MKRILCLLIVTMLCLTALAEGADGYKAFQAFDEPIKIKVIGSVSSIDDEFRPSTCYWNEALLEKLNIQLDWMWEVPGDQYNTKLSASLASGNYPDILQCDFQTFTYLKNAGALMDLSDAFEEYASTPLKNSYVDLSVFDRCRSKSGELLAIPYASDPMTSIGVMYYRTDWLENVGLSLPQTIDDLTEIIQAFRDDDPDGNGEDDTYGLALQQNVFSSVTGAKQIFEAFGSYPDAWILKDGKVVRGLLEPETKEALDYLRELYADGYIDPEYATLSGDQVKSRLADSKLGIFAGMWYSPDGGYARDTISNNEDASFAVQAMVGQTADKPATMSMGENSIYSYQVVLKTASEEAPRALVQILNMFLDFHFYTSAEDGGSGWEWWTRAYPADSEEYKAYSSRHYSWWMPVNIWPANDTLMMYKACTSTYRTGETHPYLIGQDFDWAMFIRYAQKDRSEISSDEMSYWLIGQGALLSRISSTDDTPCATEIINDLRDSGNYVLSVFYGPETAIGNSFASTLSDYALEYANRYIMGMEAEDSWDVFVANYNEMAGAAWAEQVNAAYAAIH